MSRPTLAARRRASALLIEWQEAGVPTLITAHEAYRLTGGAVGTEGDHSASGGLNLATVALRAATSTPGSVR